MLSAIALAVCCLPQNLRADETSPAPAVNGFEILAWAFDRGNVKTFTTTYADAGPMVANGGQSPIIVEYDIEFPASGHYSLNFRYAAANARPVSLLLDGSTVAEVCRLATGSWNTSGAKWESPRKLWIAVGKRTLRLQRSGDFPHLVSLRIESELIPDGWTPHRPNARKLDDPPPRPIFTPYVPEANVEALRLAVEQLSKRFGPRYARGGEFLRRLSELEARLNQAETAKQARADFVALQREALVNANPLLDFGQLLVIKRSVQGRDLGLPRNWEGNSSLAKSGYDNSLCVLDLAGGEPALTTLYKPERNVFIGDVDLHWDADKLLFSSVGTNNHWQVFELVLAKDDSARHLEPSGALTGAERRIATMNQLELSPARQRLGVRRSSAALAATPSAQQKAAEDCRSPRPCGLQNGSEGASQGRVASPSRPYQSPAAKKPRSASVAALRQLTGEQPDVDCYDACYLPDGRIVFTSTACFVGVPCVYGKSYVANIYRMDADGRNIRQLCFDQDHNWCPTMLNNGRVLYTRWEYTDTPHSNTRLLFHMNPDGTGQTEFVGSNSYWPNSFFYARPVPGQETMVIAVVGGHHDNPRMGELVLFDPAYGRHEASGVIQRIPGRGKKVEPLIRDGLTLESWPKFLHPFPLDENFFLVSCKPTANSSWGIYLVDVFDNIVPILQLADQALFEPIPFRATARPPVIPDRVNLARKDAVIVLQDIYAGDGLRGVPRGTVKALRIFSYHFAYQNMGGLLGVVGADGPWDVKRVLGTVPVEPDGSAVFRVPANTPISLQPLDEEGKAIQLMRSWMTAMPGETVQCVGCHEKQNTAPPVAPVFALASKPSEIQPWHGPVRGFSYPREVQPVIDRHCVSCHDGQPRPDGQVLCNLRGDVRITNWSSVTPGNGGVHAGKFSVGYFELSRYVRRNGIEGDYHVLEPMEFHADTTDLVQLLKKGHHGVELDAESWDRLITWIDLNAPYHGTWGEEIDKPGSQRERRRDLLKLYANVDSDPEAVWSPDGGQAAASEATSGAVSNVDEGRVASPRRPLADGSASRPYQSPTKEQDASAPAVSNVQPSKNSVSPNWPFDTAEAQRRQTATGPITRRTVDLGGGVTLELALIPAGKFAMGSDTGEADERPPMLTRIERPFWMAVRETDNRTYALFDSAHDSRVEDKNTYQFGIHGYPANAPEQPVVRVSWQDAMAFCRWLSEKTGQRFTLPTEAQWEWACRAGSDTPFNFGGFDADFSPHANLADAKLSEFASDPYTVDVPLKNVTPYDDWIPKDSRFNDGALITVAPGRYLPNAWGLYDMHGNAAEWTRSDYAPYSHASADDRARGQGEARKVARGGSWRDLPRRSTSSYRLAYQPWQSVYNVSFRVVIETDDAALR